MTGTKIKTLDLVIQMQGHFNYYLNNLWSIFKKNKPLVNFWKTLDKKNDSKTHVFLAHYLSVGPSFQESIKEVGMWQINHRINLRINRVK